MTAVTGVHHPARWPEGPGLREALHSGRFAVTAEIAPPRGADPAAIGRSAELLRGWVDAANVTDNQSARVRFSSLAGNLLVQAAGIEPVMQLTWTARTLRDEGRLLSGRCVDPRPRWSIGTVENPFAPPLGFRARRLGKKAAAGAEFAQTQFVFDLPAFERFMAELRDLGVAQRCRVLAGVGPVRSLRTLEHLRNRVPGVRIPDGVVRRLRGVPGDRVAEEGMRLCVETIQRLREIPDVAGVHVMAFGDEPAVPELLERAGLGAAERVAVAHRDAGR